MTTTRLPPVGTFSQSFPRYMAGQFRTGAQRLDVVAGGAVRDVWTMTISEAGTFDVDDTIVYAAYDNNYPDNILTNTYTIVTGVTAEGVVADGVKAHYDTTAMAGWLSAAAPATVGGNEDIVLTARLPGQVFTLSVSDQGGAAVSVAHTTTGASAGDVYPGRVMCGYYVSGAAQYVEGTPQARMYRAADFTQMSLTWTVALLTTAGARLWTRYKFAGKEGTLGTIMDTNNNTTVTAHVAALETRFNSEWTAGAGLIATDGTGAFTVKPDVAGAVFEAHSWVEGDVDATCSAPTRVGSMTDPTYSALAAYLGVSECTPGTAPTTITGASGVYTGGSVVPLVQEGIGGIQNSQSPTSDDIPWLDGATNLGRIYNAAASGYLAFCWPDGRSPIRFTGLSSNGTAEIELTR